MHGKLRSVWDDAQSSLWFLPSVFVAVALVLGSVLVWLDTVYSDQLDIIFPWLFTGTPDAARTLLSVISGSLITVISIAFSFTLVALQQAATQLSPRVLRVFTSSRANQVVLGAYISTFVYSLIVLRSVRTADGNINAFIPKLSVSVGLILVLVCMGLLIYFIHHTAESLQVAVVVEHIRKTTLHELNVIYPAEIGEAVDSPPANEVAKQLKHSETASYVRAPSSGFVRYVDDQALVDTEFDDVEWVWVRPRVGDFVTKGVVLIELNGSTTCSDELKKRLQKIVTINHERAIGQDPLFGIRQLVDIALKALSPGVNDPTTADYAILNIGTVLREIAERTIPSSVRVTADGNTRLLINRPGWEDYVTSALDQIRREAQSDVHVTTTLLGVLATVAECAASEERRQPIQHQLDEVRRSVPQQDWSEADHDEVMRWVDHVGQVLHLDAEWSTAPVG